MKKKINNNIKLAITSLIIIIITFAPLVNSNYVEYSKIIYSDEKEISFSKVFSKPIISSENEFIKIDLIETNSYIAVEGHPKLPIFVEIFELPFNSKILNIEYKISETQIAFIDNSIEPSPMYQSINNLSPLKKQIDEEIYNSKKPYPNHWVDYKIGTGINEDNDLILFLSIILYPVRYFPIEDYIEYLDKIEVEITYTEPKSNNLNNNFDYDLVIITPSEFESVINPLANHKIKNGINTFIKTLEDIYLDFEGRDYQEKIKYFVKYAIEEFDVEYVLLIGDIKKLPIRNTDAYPWSGYHGNGILSDLYYADIYDKNANFCTWDLNNNDIFGEIDDSNQNNEFYLNIDGVDLYPDVHIGRIPCTNSEELNTIVSKIISYEEFTYDQTWFKKIILAGGDTFPISKFSPPFVYEGEITNTKVGQQLEGFEQIRLWASTHNLNAHTFNKAIRDGAGFLSYAGHGFEHGWGTYRPNSIRNKMGILQPLYYTPFIKYIKNDFRLPIIFFDACLTAKLDFNITDLKGYYGLPVTIINLLPRLRLESSDFLPSISWSFLKDENGGSIACIGATRPAYTHVDKYGVYAGAGYLDVHFFKAYEEGITVGKMHTQSQIDYINYVGKDFFTIEEFMLVGDPSLKIGGYR